MQPGDVARQVVEPVSAGLPGGIQFDTVQPFHDIHMVGDLPGRHCGFAEALDFHILAVVLPDRDGVVDDVGDHQHPLADLGFQLFFLHFQGRQFLRGSGHFRLHGFRFILFSLADQGTDLLGQGLALVAQPVRLLLGVAVLPVHPDDLVHHGQLFFLELFPDILPDFLRIVPEQVDIQHVIPSFQSCSKGLISCA